MGVRFANPARHSGAVVAGDLVMRPGVRPQPNVKDCTLVRFLALKPEALWCRGAVSNLPDRLVTV